MKGRISSSRAEGRCLGAKKDSNSVELATTYSAKLARLILDASLESTKSKA